MTIAWITFVVVEVAVVWWLAGSVRRRMKHEICVSTGFLLFAALFFEQTARIFPVEAPVLVKGSGLRIASDIVLVVSGVIAVATFLTLRYRGKPTDAWENTTQLIETGIFGLVRHPLYLAAFLLPPGMLLRRISVPALVLAVAAMLLFTAGAWFEDRWNEGKFGEGYRRYQRRTKKRFIPFLW
jgi:protein-S-isoprenylcysteine O-methyltransferase Ste14